MITFTHKGDFSKTTRHLTKIKGFDPGRILERYAQEGIAALAAATPSESGKTAGSWYYEVEHSKTSATITFFNSHMNKGVNIAIILQYGHGTGTGGYVQGRDYINPAIQPVFDRIANEAWKEVTA